MNLEIHNLRPQIYFNIGLDLIICVNYDFFHLNLFFRPPNFLFNCRSYMNCSSIHPKDHSEPINNNSRTGIIHATHTHTPTPRRLEEDSSAGCSQMLKGRYVWWMESLTSSRSGMMARHLSEVLRSHCDQILLCPCFIVVTAWGMLGFVLPTVAIHHLWRKRTRAQWHFAFHLLSPSFPSLLHTPTHLSLPTPLRFSVEISCLGHRTGGLFSVYTCAVKLSPLFSS